MKRILFIVLFVFISLITIGCSNNNPAISINVLSVERVGETDTIEFVLQLLDKDDIPTLDNQVTFELDAIDFNDHAFYQGNIGIDKEKFDEDLNLLIRVSIDDTDSTSNKGKLKLKAIFSDGTYQREEIDFDFDCEDPFQNIYNMFANDPDAVPLLDGYRLYDSIRLDDILYTFIFEISPIGDVYITSTAVLVDDNWNLISIKLKFDFLEDEGYDALLVYTAYAPDAEAVGGEDLSLIYDENGFAQVDFDNYAFDETDYAFHQMKAYELADMGMRIFIELVEEYAGIYM